MKALNVVSFVLGSLLSIGCAHNALPVETPASAPACSEAVASRMSMQKAQAELADANAELAIYRAVTALYTYVQSESDPVSSPEELAQRVEDLMSGRGINSDLYAHAQDLKQKARVRYAKFAVAGLRDFAALNYSPSPTAKEAVVAATNAVGRIVGMPETADLLKQLDELGKKVRLAYAKKAVQYFQDCVDGKYPLHDSVVTDAEAAIVYAMHEGDDVSILIARMATATWELKYNNKHVGRNTR